MPFSGATNRRSENHQDRLPPPARKYHPDVSKENDAEAKFKDLAEARKS